MINMRLLIWKWLLVCSVGLMLCEDDNLISIDTENDSTTEKSDFSNATDAENPNSSSEDSGELFTLPSDNTTVSNNSQTYIDTQYDLIYTEEPVVERNTSEQITVTVTSTENNSTEHNSTDGFCSKDLCENGGICHEDPVELFTCECSSGHSGIRCQVDDRCAEHGGLCADGACIYAADGLTSSCECFLGTFWDNDRNVCRVPEPPCFPNPCSHEAECSASETSFRCVCPSGFDGDTCQLENRCNENDSCNNGRCELDLLEGAKICKCDANYFWNEAIRKCDDNKPPCLPNPCQHDGECSVNSNDSFSCNCTAGFFGSECELKNLCPIDDNGVSECGSGGKCVSVEITCMAEEDCGDTEKIKICECVPSYYLDERTHKCVGISAPCHPNPCEHLGVCRPTPSGSFNCSCSDGFMGERCTDRDHCILKGGEDFCRGAACKTHHDSYVCVCDDGQYFDYNDRMCKELDLCALMKCDALEECIDNQCQCQRHYIRDNDTNECKPHFCPSNPCPLSALICTEGAEIADFECGCPTGYAFNGKECVGGATCIFPIFNDCHQICSVAGESYTCSCLNEDFVLQEDNATCVYNGNVTCANRTCENGTCVVVGTEENCICRRGFIEDEDGHCIDLCSADELPAGFCPEDKCEATASGFRCKCDGKYILSPNGATCTVRRVCDTHEEGGLSCAKRNAQCIQDMSVITGFRCDCPRGTVQTQNGMCVDLCNLVENQLFCSKFRATCDITREGQLTCRCPPYFQFFTNGTVCQLSAGSSYILQLPLNPTVYREISLKNSFADRDYVADRRIVETSAFDALSVLIPTLLDVKMIVCKEKDAYLFCKLEMQFSAISEEYLSRAAQLLKWCQSTTNYSPFCVAPPSLVLQRNYVESIVSIGQTDPCDLNIKDDLCGSDTDCHSDGPSFNCTCRTGFAVRRTDHPFQGSANFIESCKDIDECESDPCDRHMVCVNTIGSYNCFCAPGYRFHSEGYCVELCNPNPCVHGLCQPINDKEFDCRCDSGYNGALCNFLDLNFKRNRTNVIIAGCVVIGCLLTIITTSLIFIARLKRKKATKKSDNRMFGTEMTEGRNVDSGAINNAYQRE